MSLSVGAAAPFPGHDEDVDVFGEALHQPVPLGEAGAAFEDEVALEVAAEDAEDLADPVVLLDRGGADPETLGGGVEGGPELA